MNASNQGTTSIIFQSADETMPKPLAPPEYRQRALRLIIRHNRSKRTASLSLSELVTQLRDPSLRDNISPLFEPLSLPSIDAALDDLVRTHEIAVSDRTVHLPESVPPGV
jgi:hypothetical protein